jgi:putative redox protein
MATKKAYIKQINGISFTAKSDSNHWVNMDGPEESFGSNAGSRPKELVLMGLGGCTGSDVVNILKKKRIQVDNFEMNITAEMSDEHPKVFTKIHIEFLLHGENIPEKDVERAIELSHTKYCAVTKMLEKSVEITNSYKILSSEMEEA